MAESMGSYTAWDELKGGPERQRWMRRHPSQMDECVAERAGALPVPLAPEELEELRKYHADWGADEASVASIEKLGRGDARVVVAGQQPGFLAGPLLILYKAAAAVKLARQLSERHPDLSFIPVFWSASEDHDFNEIRRTYWPGQSGLEEAFIQPSLSAPGLMVGLVQTESIVGGLIGQIEQTTFRTEYRESMIALLRKAYGGAAGTIESGFCTLLLRMLAGSGLVVVSPLMNWVRRRAASVMERELEHPGESTAAVLRRAEEMRAAGLEPPIHRAPAALNGFWVDHQGRRYALHHEDGKIRRVLAEAHDELEPVPAGDIVAELRRYPACVSANVVTRPIVQDAILPTVAQVVGPGEAAYLAQLGAAYDAFNVFIPVRWPRPEVVLIEPRVARNLEKCRVGLDEALHNDPDVLLQRVLRREMEQGALSEIEFMRARHRAEIEALHASLGLDAPAVRSAFDKLGQAIEKGFRSIEERLMQQRAQDQEHIGRALAIISASLRPAGLPQERALNPIVPFAINYGIDWCRHLIERIDISPSSQRQLFSLSDWSVKEDTHELEIDMGNDEGNLLRMERG